MVKALQRLGVARVDVATIGHGVDHLHVHLVARWPGTPDDIAWHGVDDWPGARRGGSAEVAESVAGLRAAGYLPRLRGECRGAQRGGRPGCLARPGLPTTKEANVTACAECDFAFETVDESEIAERLRALAAEYGATLAGVPDDVVRRRPAPGVWSPVEYCCHVRDLCFVQRERAILALVEDCPGFARMYRDERVELAHYDRQSPGEVVAQLATAAELCALVFDGLGSEQLSRRLIYNYPLPAEFDLAWMGRHTVHELVHHLGDVRAGLAG